MTTKICSKCNTEKELDQFCNSKSSSDGKRPECRECKNILAREYIKNPEVKKRQKEWCLDNYDEIRIKKRKYDNSEHAKNLRRKRKKQMKYILI